MKRTHIYISTSLPLEYLHRMETEEAQEIAQMPGKSHILPDGVVESTK